MPIERQIHFGNFLYYLRTSRGWSRVKLAEMAGVTERSIQRMEEQPAMTGIHPESIFGLAKAFEMTPEKMQIAWQSYAVLPANIRRKSVSALRDLCGKFGLTRAKAGDSMAEWLLSQPEKIQREILKIEEDEQAAPDDGATIMFGSTAMKFFRAVLTREGGATIRAELTLSEHYLENGDVRIEGMCRPLDGELLNTGEYAVRFNDGRAGRLSIVSLSVPESPQTAEFFGTLTSWKPAEESGSVPS